MEEAEIPLEHLHEQIHEHAKHGLAPWISWVALSTAILAVLAAIAGLLSGSHANEAMMSQIDAADQRGFYQAKSIKAAVLEAKTSLSPASTAADKQKAAKYQEEEAEIRSEAEKKTSRGQGALPQARGLCTQRDALPNRHCHRGDFRVDPAAPFLGSQSPRRGGGLVFFTLGLAAH